MKSLFVLGIAFAVCESCAEKNISTITLNNPANIDRKDESCIIKRADLCPDNETCVPVLKKQTGEYISSQLDDLDGDGQWDELAFVYDINKKEKLDLKVEWIAPADYPDFPIRTNVHYGKMKRPGIIEELKTDMHGKENLARGGDKDHPYPYQTDGPAWENDKMGFRHYFDGRNCRDVFGKRVPDIVLDTVGIRADGTPGDTYHVLRTWGRDIMSAANSFGLGGIAVQLPDTLLRMGVNIEETTDNVDSTRYTLVCKGPVRSIFKLDFYGWQVGDFKVDVHETMTIWSGKYGYENEIITSPLPKNAVLVTGIVGNFNDMPQRLETYEQKVVSMSTHDKQTYNKEWYMGMSLIIPMNNYSEVFNTPDKGSDILKTWCVKMKPNEEGKYLFNAYAAWELADKHFKDRDYYMNMIDEYARNIVNPVIVEISK
ncbi:DUF4861 domain-containing protein [Bacteroides salyersiae]|uniref:DUF4861 domain-containing protein n=1 Tax=Bacteroides salyersiae TaxID=291644 RepID=UPI00207B0664|nr:DUF4861 domain-containing protein [Bacteroides salyersiae]